MTPLLHCLVIMSHICGLTSRGQRGLTSLCLHRPPGHITRPNHPSHVKLEHTERLALPLPIQSACPRTHLLRCLISESDEDSTRNTLRSSQPPAHRVYAHTPPKPLAVLLTAACAAARIPSHPCMRPVFCGPSHWPPRHPAPEPGRCSSGRK